LRKDIRRNSCSATT